MVMSVLGPAAIVAHAPLCNPTRRAYAMGMAAVLPRRWTADEVRAIPEDSNRYELLDGELFVTPSPSSRHQAVVEELFFRLSAFCRETRVGRARLAPADIEFSPRRLVQPDCYVIPWTERPPREWAESRDLLLAVEVLSPATARADRHRKRVIYQAEGIPEYWVVDPDARLVERWRPEDVRPEILSEILIWAPHPQVAPLQIELSGFFLEALGDG